MNSLLAKRNTIYGVCALWIVLFHVYGRIGMPYIPFLTNLICIGNMAVDIFFFFSGLCLALSVKKHDYPVIGWKEYFKRRFVRIIIPYLIISIPYYLWAVIFESSPGLLHKTVAYLGNLSSASFWIYGKETTWYAYAIILFYLLFPLLYTFIHKHHKIKTLILLCGMIVFAIITAYLPILNHSKIVWARLPVFTIGIIAGEYCDRNREAGWKQCIIAAAVFLGLGALTSVSVLTDAFSIPSIFRLLLFTPMTLALLTVLSKIGRDFKALAWIGGLSFEIYLVHITLLHPIKYYGILDALGYWLYLVLPIVSVFLAWIVSLIGKAIKIGAK